MIRVFISSLRKELLLVIRDFHALMVLFAMPIAFILIMSMALQDTFDDDQGVSLVGRVNNLSGSDYGDYFIAKLSENRFIDLSEDVKEKTYFDITLTPSFEPTITEELQAEPAVVIDFSVDIGSRERGLITASVREAFAQTNVYYLATDLGYDENYGRRTFLKEGAVQFASGNDSANKQEPLQPNATQQNVPAWLVFAMFFVSIPISTTMIYERQQKTLLRLRTMAISPLVLYSSKLIPYMLINGIQLILMLMVGAFLLPVIGGDALSLKLSWPGMALMGWSISFAALGFAALIATLCRTTDQATVFSGVGCIILGALGGIMVPKFIMPQTMQDMVLISPMGWGLEGLLDIILRGGGIQSVLTEALVLVAFGGVLLLAAIVCFKYRRDF